MTRRTTRSCRLEGDYVSVCCAQVWLKPCLPNLNTTPSGSLRFLFTGSWDVPASRNFNEIELLLRSVWFRNSDFRFMIYRRRGACFCRSGNLGKVRNNPLIQTTVIQTTNKMRDMKPVMKTGTTIWTLYGFVRTCPGGNPVCSYTWCAAHAWMSVGVDVIHVDRSVQQGGPEQATVDKNRRLE
jgi:hypothetical protein